MLRPRELYSIAALARYGALEGASINAAFGGENHTTALRASEMHPPFGALRHHLPPAERWDYGCLAMEPCVSAGKHRNLFCPLNRGKSGTAG